MPLTTILKTSFDVVMLWLISGWSKWEILNQKIQVDLPLSWKFAPKQAKPYARVFWYSAFRTPKSPHKLKGSNLLGIQGLGLCWHPVESTPVNHSKAMDLQTGRQILVPHISSANPLDGLLYYLKGNLWIINIQTNDLSGLDIL